VHQRDEQREQRRGIGLGFAAYLMWGVFPLYFPLLEPAGALEILAHRVLWSLVVVALVLAVQRDFGWIRTLGRRRFGLLSLAGALIAVNWGTYIYGVNSEHVVETSLGYFINPLVTIALGVLVLGERLRRAQWVAIAVGVVAVVVLTVDYGHPPWIALVLAASFGLYGLVKKQAGVDAVHSLAVETAVLVVPAALMLGVLTARGTSTFTTQGPGHALLLASCGLVTAVPLLCFGAAAVRVPLTTIGLLQYLTPVLQFLCGVLVAHEEMPGSRWVGFGLVWIALVLLTADSLRSARARQLAAAAESVAA
jgi:chloramphenicol-sensitive protein RarD